MRGGVLRPLVEERARGVQIQKRAARNVNAGRVE